jgi:phage protein D
MAVSVPTWRLLYAGNNITGNLLHRSARLEYQEQIGGKASHLEITLADPPPGHFQNNTPTAGAVVNLAMGYQGAPLVSCGDFEVDEWELHGPPDLFTLRCLQAGISSAFRSPKNVAFENKTLTQIATQIANNYGMTVSVDAVDPDIAFTRVTQKTQSDLAFLLRLANEHNYDFNIRGSQLVFYSRPAVEATPVITSILKKTICTRFKIHKQHVGHRAYKNAKVGYFNPQMKALVNSLATDSNATSVDTLTIIERAETSQHATLKASSHLHTANMRQIQGEFTIVGSMIWRAGNTTSIQGFGDFDTVKWVVQAAKHSLNTTGWLTTLTLRTTVAGTKLAQVISDEHE